MAPPAWSPGASLGRRGHGGGRDRPGGSAAGRPTPGKRAPIRRRPEEQEPGIAPAPRPPWCCPARAGCREQLGRHEGRRVAEPRARGGRASVRSAGRRAAGRSRAAGWRRGWLRAGFGGEGVCDRWEPNGRGRRRACLLDRTRRVEVEIRRERAPEPEPGGQSLPGPGYRRGWRGRLSRASSDLQADRARSRRRRIGREPRSDHRLHAGQGAVPQAAPDQARQEVGHAPTRSR